MISPDRSLLLFLHKDARPLNSYVHKYKTGVITEVVGRLLFVQEITGSVLGPNTGCPDLFPFVFSLPPGIFPDATLKRLRQFHIVYNLLFIKH